MTVAELKKELADADDDMEVMVLRDKATRFHKSEVTQSVEIDVSERDGGGGYLRTDIFTRSLHRKRVIVIV